MKKFLCFLAITALLTACSPYQLVNSETYNNADLADYSTFRIVTPAMGKLPPGMEMVTYYNIAAAIRSEMLMRGFQESETSPLLINIAVTTQRELQTEPLVQPGFYPYYGPYYPYYMWPRYNYGPYWNPAYYNNAQVITGIYKEGVLTMDFVNIDTKTPLYSASVATIINGGGNGYQNLQGITQAVETLFSRFPVPLLPQYRNGK
jgi:lipoprotein